MLTICVSEKTCSVHITTLDKTNSTKQTHNVIGSIEAVYFDNFIDSLSRDACTEHKLVFKDGKCWLKCQQTPSNTMEVFCVQGIFKDEDDGTDELRVPRKKSQQPIQHTISQFLTDR